MKLHKEILPSNSLSLLDTLIAKAELSPFYLAGGTALALQIGHRKSYDFDFFTNLEFKSNLIHSIDKPYELIALHNNSIEFIKDNTKIMFMYFGFPLNRKIITINNLKLADPIDIGLMKLLALQGRTSRKDIIDLYIIDQKIMPLNTLLDLFEEHFSKESFNIYKNLKVLIDRNILDNEPMPRMLINSTWEEMLNTVERKVALHIKKLLT